MQALIKKLGIDETYTKPTNLPKKYTSVKDQVPHKADYNFMADLLFLPETKDGYKYLLCVVDIGTDEFDFESLKSKEPAEVLAALKTIFKRKYLKKPYASIATDSGAEFKGVFAKWLYDENIRHKVTEPARHKQMANIENLNKQLGRILNGYMNMMEEKTGKTFKEWNNKEVMDAIRRDLNASRKKAEKDIYTEVYPVMIDTPSPTNKSKFNVGDIVYRISEVPLNALKRKQPTASFRVGDYRWDLVPRKIVKVLEYSGKIPFRYVLDYLPHVSYADFELKKAKPADVKEKFVVKKILEAKTEKKKKYLKVWWKGYKKADSTWEPYDVIKEDAPQAIVEFDGKA